MKQKGAYLQILHIVFTYLEFVGLNSSRRAKMNSVIRYPIRREWMEAVINYARSSLVSKRRARRSWRSEGVSSPIFCAVLSRTPIAYKSYQNY